MTLSGITWRGESIDDVDLLRELPSSLVRILTETNGFILCEGSFHLRGASLTPDWHSLRFAWQGPRAFHMLYESVQPTDIPFAQDQVGDQFLIRGETVLRLSAETGVLEPIADSLDDFLKSLSDDIKSFLNVGLGHTMQPGQLLLAYPPFVFRESGSGACLKPVPAGEVILFHSDLARQIRDIPDGKNCFLKLLAEDN